MNQDYWIRTFAHMGAFWKHDGDPNRPHALLTKGGHSDGFFNWNLVAQHPRTEHAVAVDLLQLPNLHLGANSFPYAAVCGPGNGAITLTQSLAREMCEKLNLPVRGIFTEKGPKGVSLARFSVNQGENVIVCEDTITSGGSVQETIRVVEAAGGVCSPFILCVCNRSSLTHIGEKRILSLIEVSMNVWAPDVCPWCKKGSEAIAPKKENWERLTGKR